MEKSTGYTFRLVDVDGVEGGGDESWQFRVLADAPPSVVIEQPAGDLFVTERAVVNFRVRARDDMALRQVVLVLRPSDAKAAKERTIPLFQRTRQASALVLRGLRCGRGGRTNDDRLHAGTCPNSSFRPACN